MISCFHALNHMLHSWKTWMSRFYAWNCMNLCRSFGSMYRIPWSLMNSDPGSPTFMSLKRNVENLATVLLQKVFKTSEKEKPNYEKKFRTFLSSYDITLQYRSTNFC